MEQHSITFHNFCPGGIEMEQHSITFRYFFSNELALGLGRVGLPRTRPMSIELANAGLTRALHFRAGLAKFTISAKDIVLSG